MQVASDRAALGRWNPEVGATGVENDLEGLGRSPEGDLGEVWALSATAQEQLSMRKPAQRTLGVQKVRDGHGMCSVCDIRRFEDLLNVRLMLDAHVLLSEGLRLLVEVGVLLGVVSTRCIT